MSRLSRFQILGLHGIKDVDLRLKDNTLILVGENGTGKTTILNLLYYLLSGQWGAIARYRFDCLKITIEGKQYKFLYSDFQDSREEVEKRLQGRLPPSVLRRVVSILEQNRGSIDYRELEMLSDQYGIPFNFLLRELSPFDPPYKGLSSALTEAMEKIKESLNAQILYLPTYRRIEQELDLIIKGLDERELLKRRRLLSARRSADSYVELVEFGMRDVESAIQDTRDELDKFARANLNNLTFGYLGDIVEQRYESVNLEPIRKADPSTIENILSRIQEPVLSMHNKQRLKELIQSVKANSTSDVHSQVICHYFTKLMEFHRDLETKEAKIVSFCDACNAYMVDKRLQYNTLNFSFRIMSLGNDGEERTIELQNLSSGEKQIVSLFSHLHLSGSANYFVLIDEPELSLSVDWQRRFLSDIRKASFCSGLLAVTHSPFIYDNELRRYAHGLGEFIA